MDELRECPWCGEKPAGLSICEGSTFRWVIGSCPSCGANPGEIRRDTSISAEDRHIEDEKIAIAAWNTRAQPKPEVAPDDEAALAACRDKTIEECARAADTYIVEGLETVNSVKREIASSIRTLKTKEPTNG